MSASNPLKAIAVNVVALLYGHDSKFRELDAITKKMVEQCDDHEGDCCPGLQMVVLYFTSYSLGWQGRYNESAGVNRRLSELTGSELELQLPNVGAGAFQISTTFNMYGLCAKTAKRHHGAEDLFRKAAKAQETGGLTTSYQAVWTVVEPGRCVRESGAVGGGRRAISASAENPGSPR